MKNPPLLALLVAAGIVGWFAPDFAGGDAAQPAGGVIGDPPRSPPASLAALQTEQWLGGETVLQRADDGHYYAEATAAGVPLTMLVDTGASMVALTGEDAEAAGLLWDNADLTHVAQGASGPVEGVFAKIDSLRVGEMEVRDVDAVIVPDGLGISLLGQSFLSHIRRVEIEGQKMVLAD